MQRLPIKGMWMYPPAGTMRRRARRPGLQNSRPFVILHLTTLQDGPFACILDISEGLSVTSTVGILVLGAIAASEERPTSGQFLKRPEFITRRTHGRALLRVRKGALPLASVSGFFYRLSF